jgi:hypothetical protein
MELIKKIDPSFDPELVVMGKIRENLIAVTSGILIFLWKHPLIFLQFLLMLLQGLRPVELLSLGLHYKRWRDYYQSRGANPPALFVAEDLFFGMGSYYAALDHEIPIIALPHNIDSLTIAAGSVGAKARRLAMEMAMLKKASHVCSISQWDSMLHSQFGITSDILSYFPPAEWEAELREKRNHRTFTNGAEYLIAGSCHNEMTRRGIQQLVDYLCDQIWPHGYSFHLAGLKVAELIHVKNPSLIKVHGFLPAEEFKQLHASVKCLIVHQTTGSGALTRILDSLISGIPVVANRIAAREWEGYSGTYLYHHMHEIPELLKQLIPTPPVPSHRLVEEELLVKKIKHTLL